MTAPREPHPSPPAQPERTTATTPVLQALGRRAWAVIGIAIALFVLGKVVAELSLVVVPVFLALFPAALLMPVSRWLKRVGAPPALASLATILGLLLALAGIIAGITMVARGQIPELANSLQEGIGQLEQTIEDDPLGLGYDFPGFAPLVEDARDDLADVAGGDEEGAVAGGAAGAATAVTEALTGIVLLLVVLFFYLKDESRLSDGVIGLMPTSWRPHAHELASRFWNTVGSYFRGQLTVALFDAVLIGIGLLLLGVPLAVPLAVLVFFGALFPIVGAFISGGVAVLVALADSGPLTALLVLGLIVLVQQIEGNLLEPIIMSNAIAIHPLVVILSLTVGSVLLGVLGAFLAVPTAAGLARAIDYAQDHLRRDSPPEVDAHPEGPPDPPAQLPARV
jgi:putative heme transporter